MDYYTCIGKGGRYEYLGQAKPAGRLKVFHGDSGVAIYKCLDSGQLYFRDPLEFRTRMQKIDKAPS